MKDPKLIHVFGPEGELGWLVIQNEQADPHSRILQLIDGTTVEVPAESFVKKEDGSYYLPIDGHQLKSNPSQPEKDQAVIPVIREQVEVTKKPVNRVVRIHKLVGKHEVVVDEPGYQEEVNITRVTVNQPVEQAPEMRYEGDTLIIPVLAEVLVVEKRLVLKEEIHVTRRKKTFHAPKNLTVREESVRVERLNKTDAAPSQEK